MTSWPLGRPRSPAGSRRGQDRGDGPAAAAAAQADAGQAGPHDPRRRRLAVRAEVGRLPLHRVPRRRRHRAGQPQRAAVHPLLPRAARPAAGVAARTAASSTARSSSPTATAAASTSTPCCSASTRPSRACAGWRPRRRRRSSPSTCSPSATTCCSTGRCRSAATRCCGRSAPEPPVHLTPASTDPAVAAEWFGRFEGAGLDGVVAKRLDDPYQPDKRALVKVKHERTADCVVAGYRIHKDGKGVGSLLLGLYDDEDRLQHVGVAAAFRVAFRSELLAELEPLTHDAVDGHPWQDWAEWQHSDEARKPGATSRWNAGKDLSWVPIRVERVRRGDVRPAGEAALPPRRLVRPLAPRPRAGRAAATTSSTSPPPSPSRSSSPRPDRVRVRGAAAARPYSTGSTCSTGQPPVVVGATVVVAAAVDGGRRRGSSRCRASTSVAVGAAHVERVARRRRADRRSSRSPAASTRPATSSGMPPPSGETAMPRTGERDRLDDRRLVRARRRDERHLEAGESARRLAHLDAQAR